MAEVPIEPTDREFVARLNQLFASIPPGDGRREYSNSEIGRQAGVSGAYLGQLRNGRRRPPSKQVARGIEEAFGLDEPYLLSEDSTAVQAIDQQLAQLRELHDRGVWRFALRAREIQTPEGRALLDAAIDHVLHLESTQSGTRTDNQD